MLARRAAALAAAAAAQQTTLRHAVTALGSSASRASHAVPSQFSTHQQQRKDLPPQTHLEPLALPTASVPWSPPVAAPSPPLAGAATPAPETAALQAAQSARVPADTSVHATSSPGHASGPTTSSFPYTSSSPASSAHSLPHTSASDSPLLRPWCRSLNESLPLQSQLLREHSAGSPSLLQARAQPSLLSGRALAILLPRRGACQKAGIDLHARTFAARATDASLAPADVSATSASGGADSAPESAGAGSSAAGAVLWNPAPVKTKALTKQVKHIMNLLDTEAVTALRSEREIPDFRPGDVLAMKVEIPENKRRISLVKGIVIAKRNAGVSSTFRIRRMMAGVGVEMVFPLYSPNIKEIKVIDKRRARRAKLYYLREKIARLSTVN